MLLLRANRAVPPADIIDAVWGGDPPSNGANVVQKHISGLRRALEPDRQPRLPSQRLTLTDAGYLVRVDQGGLDVDAFRGQVDQAYSARAAGALPHAAQALRHALGRWRGVALAGLSGPYFGAERERLTEIRMGALEECLELEVRLGRHVLLVPELTALIAQFPFRERLRGLLMRALHQSGRVAESLAVDREAHRYLVEELGVEPGEELQRLHKRILEASLPPVAPPPPVADGGAAVHVAPAVAAPPLSSSSPAGGDVHPWWVRLGTLWLPLVSFASIGFLSWAPATYAALRLRSPVNGVLAVAYFVLIAFCLVVGGSNASPYEQGVTTTIVLLSWIGGTVHGAILRTLVLRLRASLVDPFVALVRHRRTRREAARQILRREPALARDLRIGRPDLPRQYDDGGLVDLNNVPEHVLTSTLGVTSEQAHQIVTERQRTGGFAAVEELAQRGLLSEVAVRSLADVLIVVR